MDTNAFLTVLDLRMKHLYAVTSGDIKEEFSPYTNKVDHNQITYMTTGVTGLAMGQIIGEGQIPASDAPIQGFSKVYTQAIFTHRVRFTHRNYYYLFVAKDAKKIDEGMKKTIVDLKNAITELKNYYSQSLLANGWNTAFTFTSINGGLSAPVNVDSTGADGISYWSLVHPREDGGTAWANIVTSGTINPLFNLTSLIAARSIHADKKDGRGLPLRGSQLDKLVCLINTQTYYLAVSLKKTLDSGKFPAANLISGNVSLVAPIGFVDASPTESFDIIPLSRYGGTGLTNVMWFMFDSKKVSEDYGFQFIESMTPVTSSIQDDLGNFDYVSTILTYCQFGASDLRYWMASNGTLA